MLIFTSYRFFSIVSMYISVFKLEFIENIYFHIEKKMFSPACTCNCFFLNSLKLMIHIRKPHKNSISFPCGSECVFKFVLSENAEQHNLGFLTNVFHHNWHFLLFLFFFDFILWFVLLRVMHHQNKKKLWNLNKIKIFS